jgi:capsule polysaccharide export protein KpsE/RkpR
VAQTGYKTQIEAPPASTIEEMQEDAVTFEGLGPAILARLRLLWENRRFLKRAAFVGLCMGLLVAFMIPARYESSTQLMPPDNQSGAGLAMFAALTAKTGGNSGLGAVAGDLLGMKSSGALFIGVLNSKTVEDRLIERFQLKKVYAVRLDEDAQRRLAESTAISEDRKSGIITVTVTDRDPRRAAAIAQAYVGELNQLVAQLSTSAAHRERVFLEERLTAVKQDLDDASQKFSQFSSKNTTIDIKEQGRAMVEAASVLQGQLIAAESEFKGLEQIYTPNNVRVRAVGARISELQRQLEKLSGKGFGEAGQKPDTSLLYPSIRELPILGVTYADLYRRTRIQEAVFETLTQQYELAKVQEAKETPSVKVLDVARVPERKAFPPRGLFALLGAFLAFGVAAMVVFVRSRWDDTDASDESKIFVREVFHTVNARMPWAAPNGSNVQATTHKVWVRLVRRRDAEKYPKSLSK